MVVTPVADNSIDSRCAHPLEVVEHFVKETIPLESLIAHTSSDTVEHIVAVPGLEAFICAHLSHLSSSAGALIVTATERHAQTLSMTLQQSLQRDCVYFPAWETFPGERLSPGVDTVGLRCQTIDTLYQVVTNNERDSEDAPVRAPIVITTIRALMQPVTVATPVAQLRLRVGMDVDFDEAKHHLFCMGYTMVDLVAKPGDIAFRGGIIDLFPSTSSRPVRIDFFGDEISEMHYFSTSTQRNDADEKLEEIVVYPAKELIMTPENRERARAVSDELPGAVREMAEKFSVGNYAPGAEVLAGILSDRQFPLLSDFIAQDSPVIMCNPWKISTRAQDMITTSKEFYAATWDIAALSDNSSEPMVPIEGGNELYSVEDIIRRCHETGRKVYSIDELNDGVSSFLCPVEPIPAPSGHPQKMSEFIQECSRLASAGENAVIVVVASPIAAERVHKIFADHGVGAQIVPHAYPSNTVVQIVEGYLASGFTTSDKKIWVVTDTELTGTVQTHRETLRSTRKKSVSPKRRVDPLSLASGDLVVHEHHGVGRFIELVQRQISGALREYVVLEYASSKNKAGTDKLFVPMESLDLLSRYVGGNEPALSKMGGSDWQKTKRAARRAVRDIAAQLVQLYAARQNAKGFAFSPDTPWQRELEDSFPYLETPDQLAAIEDTKADMEKPIPMDRVIVGDVGYGKTEVAIRAAFKALQDGKQVAVLVPTTLLAEQHFATFSERMHGFGVTIASLSRFTSASESKKTIEKMAQGTVDIVIGTHRLLQTGVIWKDLGLVIVDEEQRFGVEHKEHITSMRTHVDVLTLSATPIPRTLEMSLSGIREMSAMTTPPTDRHPILTFVGAYNDQQIHAAISRELLRDGQVFYIHNKVATIDATAAHIRELIPEARVAVAHGQMSEDMLEKTVEGFWHRDYDVLVCTTIVETGLDISNANTLIVEHSENLGLSQLHQLRGRVGRSKERGYAYFFYSPHKVLTEMAYDRLSTIALNTDLGSGMAVAMKDLEIRGAGNILGAEQSGHIAGVGFDLYVRLVSEAVEAYRAVLDGKDPSTEEKIEVRVDIPVDAHIPPEYIASERLRLSLYREIASATDTHALVQIIEETKERFGVLPEPVMALMHVAQLRSVLKKFNITEVTVNGNNLRIAPIILPDSGMVRLKRLFPSAIYRAASHTVMIPLSQTSRMGAPRMEGSELLQFIASTVHSLNGLPKDSVIIGSFPVPENIS